MGQHGEKTAADGEISVARWSTIVFCENTVCHTRPSANALDFVRSAGNGFLAMTLHMRGGVELSVRIRGPNQFVNGVWRDPDVLPSDGAGATV